MKHDSFYNACAILPMIANLMTRDLLFTISSKAIQWSRHKQVYSTCNYYNCVVLNLNEYTQL